MPVSRRNAVVQAIVHLDARGALRVIKKSGAHIINGIDGTEGYTPLTAAAARGDAKIVAAVLARGAIRGKKDALGLTAAHVVKRDLKYYRAGRCSAAPPQEVLECVLALERVESLLLA